ncbi:TetR/AcrR family transcriptional regulator [Glycomyces paridis]|uniref:TetR/AcrR family transcriptional regulator n=1 Tax=Glycomyces paridis TaxID=2126555 RepID=A0A4S8PMR3_9ACTN|nr:TetR/AcrR family transcriptional regulator [Glycomyces paridis]THV31421.1 TetR/AcrR family transcriptional regulator [Glycomyces paridis]
MSSTRDRIVGAARELVDEGGSETVSMRKIGSALGLSAMAVYRHFPSREVLLAHVADECFDEVHERWRKVGLTGDSRTDLHAVVDRMLDLAFERPHQFALMFLEPRERARAFPADFDSTSEPVTSEPAASEPAASEPVTSEPASGRSKTFALLTDLIADGIAAGTLRPGPPWAVGLSVTASLYGLVQLRRGGRIDLPDDAFRALCHHDLERTLDGIAA